MLNEHNELVKQFRVAAQRAVSHECPDLAVRIIGTGSSDPRVYSPPTSSELASLIVGDLTVDRYKFDIIAETVDSLLRRICPLHVRLMALQYPLLFLYGEKGFHLGINYKVLDDRPVGGRDTVTMLEYHCYRCHYRPGQPNPYSCVGRLSEQAMVDAYSCVEADRLTYVVNNQNKLRSSTYQGLSDAIGEGVATGKNVGVKMLLPASFIGSPRYMAQNYQDCMAICRAYGAPDLFVTFTCNPRMRSRRHYNLVSTLLIDQI